MSGRIFSWFSAVIDDALMLSALLKDLGVDYYYTNVDLLTADEKQKIMKTVEKWNPDSSFPTLVIDEKRCIVGFREDEIRKLVKP